MRGNGAILPVPLRAKALPQAKSTGKPAKNADKPQIDNDNTKE